MNNPFFETPLQRALREAQKRREEQQKQSALAALLARQRLLGNTLLTAGLVKPKRNVFISYHHGDDIEVRTFVKRWTETEKVFIPKGLGLRFTDDIINSDNPEYVMAQIRKKYLQNASVTIVLLGTCTHSRRYVDWEIKASLRQEIGGRPNGLMGIILPSLGRAAHLPLRLEENWNNGHTSCYARLWVAPRSASELRGWIEDAYSARTSRTRFIKNSGDMMKYNATCKTCGIVHPA